MYYYYNYDEGLWRFSYYYDHHHHHLFSMYCPRDLLRMNLDSSIPSYLSSTTWWWNCYFIKSSISWRLETVSNADLNDWWQLLDSLIREKENCRKKFSFSAVWNGKNTKKRNEKKLKWICIFLPRPMRVPRLFGLGNKKCKSNVLFLSLSPCCIVSLEQYFEVCVCVCCSWESADDWWALVETATFSSNLKSSAATVRFPYFIFFLLNFY